MSSIPGFTAETSLGRGEMRFVGETSAAVRGAGEVVAQARRVRYPVDCDSMVCHQSRGYWICYCG
jgi:hypothetical protein